MKAKLHPELHESRGQLRLREQSSRPVRRIPTIKVEICSNCHPFFTGKQKLVDSAGRVERFQKRYAKKEA